MRPLIVSFCSVLFACGPLPDEGDDTYVDHDMGVVQQGLTVGQAGGCDTSIVAGLTNQLVAELNCIAPNTMVNFTAPDVHVSTAVVPYLNPGASAAMKRAVSASGTFITLSSAYRSVAQQYLLVKWKNAGQCNIQAVATPGKSNHQSGRAIDVPSYNFWISKLQAQSWTWFGSADLVHFDYLSAPNLGSNSVLAFQKLWNKNHTTNKLIEDGDWGPMTESAMASSPTTGFTTFGCAPPPPQTGTLKGKITEAGNATKVIAGATVKVSTKTLTTDAMGNYTVDLPGGTYTITVTATGYVNGSLSRTVTAGQTVTGNLGLAPVGMPDTVPPEIALTSPDDLAVLGTAQVTLEGTASDAQGTVATFTLAVNGGAASAVQLLSGAFSQAVHLSPGANMLRFRAVDDKGNASTLDVTLTFNTGIDGVVLGDMGSIGGASVSADDGAGKIVSATSAGDGTFHLDLAPGHYTLRAIADGLNPLEQPFDVGAEQRESATLTLSTDIRLPALDSEHPADTTAHHGCAAAPGLLLGAAVLVFRRRRSR